MTGLEIFLALFVVALCVCLTIVAVKLDTARHALKDADDQLDEDEDYIRGLRLDIEELQGRMEPRRTYYRPGRLSGIIDHARRP